MLDLAAAAPTSSSDSSSDVVYSENRQPLPRQHQEVAAVDLERVGLRDMLPAKCLHVLGACCRCSLNTIHNR